MDKFQFGENSSTDLPGKKEMCERLSFPVHVKDSEACSTLPRSDDDNINKYLVEFIITSNLFFFRKFIKTPHIKSGTDA